MFPLLRLTCCLRSNESHKRNLRPKLIGSSIRWQEREPQAPSNYHFVPSRCEKINLIFFPISKECLSMLSPQWMHTILFQDVEPKNDLVCTISSVHAGLLSGIVFQYTKLCTRLVWEQILHLTYFMHLWKHHFLPVFWLWVPKPWKCLHPEYSLFSNVFTDKLGKNCRTVYTADYHQYIVYLALPGTLLYWHCTCLYARVCFSKQLMLDYWKQKCLRVCFFNSNIVRSLCGYPHRYKSQPHWHLHIPRSGHV